MGMVMHLLVLGALGECLYGGRAEKQEQHLEVYIRQKDGLGRRENLEDYDR